MSQSNGHGPAAPPQLLKLLAKHQRIVDSIRETLQALGVDQTRSATARGPQTLAKALALDEQRRAPKKPRGAHSKKVLEQRRRSVQFLAQFNRDTPTPLEESLGPANRMVGALVRYGYLKPKGDGFVRTAREFSEKKTS